MLEMGRSLRTRRLRHTPSTSSAARSALRADLRRSGVTTEAASDAEIVLGELVANALEHGEPFDDGTIEIGWALTGDRLSIAVADSGTAALIRPGALTGDAPRGRGLALVAALSEIWAYDGSRGTRVVAVVTVR